jgi:hypothetical protein
MSKRGTDDVIRFRPESEAIPAGHYTHGELTRETHPALFAAIAQAFAVPPPDVWEYRRRHGRWPKPGEA